MIIDKIIEALADCDIKPLALLPFDMQDQFNAEVPAHLNVIEVDGAGNTSVSGVPVILTGHVKELTMVVRYVEISELHLRDVPFMTGQ